MTTIPVKLAGTKKKKKNTPLHVKSRPYCITRKIENYQRVIIREGCIEYRVFIKITATKFDLRLFNYYDALSGF